MREQALQEVSGEKGENRTQQAVNEDRKSGGGVGCKFNEGRGIRKLA